MVKKDFDSYITWAGASSISLFSLMVSTNINQVTPQWVSFASIIVWLSSSLIFLALFISKQHSVYCLAKYTKWDGMSDFGLLDAACLWAEEEPSERPSRRACTQFKRLKRAIEEEKLSARLSLEEAIDMAANKHLDWTKNDDDPINVNTRVGREALNKYARSVNEKPKFLFAGRRP